MAAIGDLLEDLLDQKDSEKISLGDIVETFENRGFGPLLVVPALVALLPTGAIPGVPTTCGIFIILISLQLLAGRSNPWLPKWLRNLSISRKKLESGIEKVRPWSDRLDHSLKPRLSFLTGETMTRVIAGLVSVLAILIAPLELVPMAAAVPALAILLFGISLVSHDGLIALLGLIATGLVAWLAVRAAFG